MNDKILKLAQSLYNNEDCRNQKFQLTLNYKEVIKDEYLFENILGTKSIRNTVIIYPLLNEKGMKRIGDELSKVDVENFNLTVKYENGKDNSEKYTVDWYTCSLIFHGKGKIELAFDMLSSYSTFSDGSFNRYIGKTNITEDKLDEVVQKMVDLKTILVENGERVINKLSEIKNSNN